MEAVEQYRRDGFAPMPCCVHTNGIGYVTAIINDFGNLVERVSYDVFGMPTFTDYQTDPQKYIGIALHIIQDSYAPSHAARNDNMELTRIQDYSAQNGGLNGLHKKNGDFREGADDKSNMKFYLAAVEATKKVLRLALAKDFNVEAFKHFLRTEIFKLKLINGKPPKDILGGTEGRFESKDE